MWCPMCEQEVMDTVLCYDGARRCVMCRIEDGFDDAGNPMDPPEDYLPDAADEGAEDAEDA